MVQAAHRDGSVGVKDVKLKQTERLPRAVQVHPRRIDRAKVVAQIVVAGAGASRMVASRPFTDGVGSHQWASCSYPDFHRQHGCRVSITVPRRERKTCAPRSDA